MRLFKQLEDQIIVVNDGVTVIEPLAEYLLDEPTYSPIPSGVVVREYQPGPPKIYYKSDGSNQTADDYPEATMDTYIGKASWYKEQYAIRHPVPTLPTPPAP
jgi:hypothetical protein